MAEVDVTIGGRTYRLACDDGQEAHLRKLSARIDAEARNFAAAGSQIPESRLLLMSALMIADKLDEAENEAALSASAPVAHTAAEAAQNSLFSDAAMEDAVSQIDAAADRLRALSAAADEMADETQPSPEEEDDPSQFDVDPPAEASLFDLATPEPEAREEPTAKTASAAVEHGVEPSVEPAAEAKAEEEGGDGARPFATANAFASARRASGADGRSRSRGED